MRVDIVTKEYPPNIYGGAGVHVWELVKQLRLQIDVEVHAFGEPVSEAKTHGYNVPEGQLNPTLGTIVADANIASSTSGADLVHSHTWYANFAGFLAKKLHGIPHVITAHSLEPMRPWKREQLGGGYDLSSWIEKTSFEDADSIIAVSHGMRNDILQSYPQLDASKVVVIHNGIDPIKWSPSTDDQIISSLGINPASRSVTFVGRITKQKGLRYLLKAAEQLPADIQLVLCAGAADTKELEKEIEDLVFQLRKTRQGVIWIPEHLPQTSLRAVLSATTLFACPSVYEPLGIVNLEAMACEAPVVATATGGIPEVVKHGETGLLVPIEQLTDGSGTPLDEQKFVGDFAAAMNQALAMKDLKQMGIAGRARALAEFDWKNIANKTVAHYDGVLNR